MPTLGVTGTLVRDRIVPKGGEPVERWGGIGYAISAAVVALPPEWTVRPVVRVGADLEEPARALLAAMPRLDMGGIEYTPEANNRVELRYHDDANRVERLTGGVGGWSADGLRGAIDGCDALLVNFISGFEAELEVVEDVVAGFRGYRYVDLHSLFLGLARDGTRFGRALPDWRRWAGCFDVVQVNEEEFDLLGTGPDAVTSIEGLLDAGPAVAVVTRGAAGATVATRSTAGRYEVEEVILSISAVGDPTGCGDVWGAAMCARLLSGEAPVDAARTANRMAAASVGHSGVDGLVEYLQHEVGL